MKHAITLTLALAVVFAARVMAAQSPGASFIEEALKGNIWEVQVGQLAARKATNPQARKFGAMLNTDHGEATRKAALAAQSLGVTPATSLDPKQQAKYDRLAKLEGESFDRAFIEAMVADHQQDIAKYEKAAQGTDAAATYAKQTLPRLREHLATAQQLQQSEKDSKSSG
jgi:putative membrane protein